MASGYEGFLQTLNLKNERVEKQYHKKLKYPFALCIGKNDEIFVAESESSAIGLIEKEMVYCTKILIFDSNFNFQSDFNFKHKHYLDRMIIDNDKNILFISHPLGNQITKLDSQKGDVIGTIEIDSPKEMQLNNDFLYVVSWTTFTKNKNTNKFECLTRGSNCIFVLNTENNAIIQTIKFNNLLKPSGIHFANELCILTTAYELDENDIVSKNSFLFKISLKNGEIIKKIEIDDVKDANDIILFDNKMLVWLNSSIRFLEFQ